MNKWRLLLAFAAVGLLVGAWQGGLFSLLAEPARLKEEVLALEAWGFLLFVLVFSFISPFGLPGLALVIGATYVWPRPIAYGLSLAGAMGASAVGFGFARFIGRDWVSARLPERIRRYDVWIEKRGWLATAGLRAIFLMHPLLHALFGISRMKFAPYMLGCAIGYIPALAVVTWASGSVVDAVKDQPKERFILVGVIIVTLFILRRTLTWWWRKRKRANETSLTVERP
ncbi:MAG: TVP38/TMEM64 family protein [Polyangiaceae bacterium]|nr:TVP38/TMEM64 family protein [Polyangiaceae bacterium]